MCLYDEKSILLQMIILTFFETTTTTTTLLLALLLYYCIAINRITFFSYNYAKEINGRSEKIFSPLNKKYYQKQVKRNLVILKLNDFISHWTPNCLKIENCR